MQDTESSITLKEAIQTISDNFIQEARRSPALLSDMAAMEKYMAESYSGRVFAELLQNADDCHSTKVGVYQKGNDLFFANNGRPFNREDITAICRSGASSKKRGQGIGYRGVGFKSSTHISDEIIIWSNGVSFSFSKSYCAHVLNSAEKDVPTVRIPFYVDSVDGDIYNFISELNNKGYTTVFVFVDAKMEEFISELESTKNDYFIFLNNILQCDISTSQVVRKFSAERIMLNENETFYVDNNTQENWHIYKSKSCSVAIKQIERDYIPCASTDATYHCYLPTLDKTPFALKINADFSTDPSRKHITVDKITGDAIESVAKLLACLCKDALTQHRSFGAQLFTLLSAQSSFSKTSQLLISNLKEYISETGIALQNDRKILLSQYKTFPNWLEPSEIMFLRSKCAYIKKVSLPEAVYKQYDGVDTFIASYSKNKFELKDFEELLEQDEQVLKTMPDTYCKILARIVREEKSHSAVYHTFSNQTKNLPACISNVSKADSRISTVLQETLSNSEAKWLSERTGLKLPEKETPKVELPLTKTTVVSKRPIVSKWRSAEQQAVQIEEFLGNKAIDVSKKNIGYDIESTTSSGEKRYIEVKSLQKDSSTFAITNNEYTSAHQLGDEYYICLIFEGKAIYIQNPLKNLSFEKRIRQWEWICEEYSGEEIELM